MAEPDPIGQLAALERDRERGAAEIARQARSALARLAQHEAPASDARNQAREAVLGLARAHPAMAPLVHLADETLKGLDDAGLAALATLPREPPLAMQVAQRAAPAIAAAAEVATYSRSGTVVAAIARALDEGPIRVHLSEARPDGEGIATARRLAEAGADVALSPDAHLFSTVGRAEVVLVGCDAITAEAFVNKTGTRSLLQAAQRAGTATWVLASTDKLWPAALPHEPRTNQQADWAPEVPDEVRVTAPPFERVPLALADRIVTEAGDRQPDELAEEAARQDVHPDVVAALAE